MPVTRHAGAVKSVGMPFLELVSGNFLFTKVSRAVVRNDGSTRKSIEVQLAEMCSESWEGVLE